MICYKPNEVNLSRAERFPSRSSPFAARPGAGGDIGGNPAITSGWIGSSLYHDLNLGSLSHYLRGLYMILYIDIDPR